MKRKQNVQMEQNSMIVDNELIKCLWFFSANETGYKCKRLLSTTLSMRGYLMQRPSLNYEKAGCFSLLTRQQALHIFCNFMASLLYRVPTPKFLAIKVSPKFHSAFSFSLNYSSFLISLFFQFFMSTVLLVNFHRPLRVGLHCVNQLQTLSGDLSLCCFATVEKATQRQVTKTLLL